MFIYDWKKLINMMIFEKTINCYLIKLNKYLIFNFCLNEN